MVRKRSTKSELFTKQPSISIATDTDDARFRLKSVARASVMNKYKISRQDRKLQISDDPRTLLALPKDVAEQTWAEILQKEENELVCFDIREEIIDAALQIGYENYMEKQNSFFTVHCAAIAMLKIIDWHFYRHDPGEDPSAYPPCFIPKRLESWTPDEMPDPSVRDSWGLRDLNVIEPCPEEILPSCRASLHSVEEPCIEPIPQEYWFPGRINLTTVYIGRDGVKKRHVMDEGYYPRTTQPPCWGLFDRVSELCSDDAYDTSAHTIDRFIDHSSEVLQKVTDYLSKDTIPASTSSMGAKDSKHSSLKQMTPADGSLQGAGDSTVGRDQAKRRSRTSKSKNSFSRPSIIRSRLPPLVAQSLSRVSIISDCRLRNLRMDTQYEVSTEKLDSPIQHNVRRKI